MGSHRDHILVMKAIESVRSPGNDITLKLMSRHAGSKRRCKQLSWCEAPGKIEYAEYLKILAGALFVAIPVLYGEACSNGEKCGLTGAGITVFSESICLGKIVAMTDTKSHLTDGYIDSG